MSDEGSSDEAEAPDELGKGTEVLERCDSAYLPRVQSLADMRPINDNTSRALSLQACSTVLPAPFLCSCAQEQIASSSARHSPASKIL